MPFGASTDALPTELPLALAAGWDSNPRASVPIVITDLQGAGGAFHFYVYRITQRVEL